VCSSDLKDSFFLADAGALPEPCAGVSDLSHPANIATTPNIARADWIFFIIKLAGNGFGYFTVENLYTMWL
jgi:hypothetical protein